MRSDERAAAWRRLHGEPIDDLAAMGFHLRASAILQRVLACLDAADVSALVVKGAVLAHSLYATPIDRPIRDVDLRVRPRDLAAAARAIAAMPRARLLVRSRVYAAAVLNVDGVEIDVEGRVGPPLLCAIGVDAMLARAERTDAGLGFAHLRPELHDHALLLVVNLFKDRLVDLAGAHVEDLARIARLPSFDVATFAARVREARCATIAHVVATRVAQLAGDARWQSIARAIPPVRRRYAERLLASLDGASRARLPLRLRVRAGSDSRPRALGALAASALFEAERALERRR